MPLRRVKTTGHPSQKVAQAIQGSYNNPSDPPWVKRATDPSPNFMWEGAPIGPDILLSGAKITIDDFKTNSDIDLTDLWNLIKDNNGATTLALLEQKGGGVRFDTGGVTAQSFSFLEKQSKTISFVEGDSVWALYDVGVINTSDPDDPDYNGLTWLSVGMNDGIVTEDGDYFGIENGIELNVVTTLTQLKVVIDGIDTTNLIWTFDNEITQSFDFTDGNTHKVGTKITPNSEDPSTFDIAIFFDEALVTTVTEVALPTEALGVSVGSLSHDDQVTIGSIITLQDD